MQNSDKIWVEWTSFLERYKAKKLVALLLDAGEPLTFVGAQMLYFGQPLLGDIRVRELAQLLEDPAQTRAFATFLRKD